MLESISQFFIENSSYLILNLLRIVLGAALLYIFLSYILRSTFRKIDSELALVTLNVSIYPALVSFLFFSFKLFFLGLQSGENLDALIRLLNVSLIISLSYWGMRIFREVIFYYLKEYTQQTEMMWDGVLLPILEAAVPIIFFTVCIALILNYFGADLQGIWVALGGASVGLGFGLKDILSDFFSGLVLLVDTPFQFGDLLQLEDGSIGMLRKIGFRVTHLYVFDNHCDVYIPNRQIQGQKIVNLNRPTPYYPCTTTIEVSVSKDLTAVERVMKQIMLAHPDTLGDLDTKLQWIDKYFQVLDPGSALVNQQEIGRDRLLAEKNVNDKLEEIDLELGSIVVTLQFAQEGGIEKDEMRHIQAEFKGVLQAIGWTVMTSQTVSTLQTVSTFDEVRDKNTLLALIRSWYRLSIRDPNLLDEDEEFIPQDWERKIAMLKRKLQRVQQKIDRYELEETRLDDYILKLRQWIQERFKTPRRQWQNPQILISELSQYDSDSADLVFTLNFFVDDMKLENGRRSDRVSSQIHREIVRSLKQDNDLIQNDSALVE